MNLELKNDDFKKEVLVAENGYERVTEQIKGDLGDLHESILKDFNDDADKKSDVIVDITPAKKFLKGLKDKNFSEIQAEGASWAFAVQLLLKNKKDTDGNPFYKGKVDGLYGGSGGQTNAAVKAFQKSVGFTGKNVDGWAGGDTIKRLLEEEGVYKNTEEVANSDNTSTVIDDNKVDTNKIEVNEPEIIEKLKLKVGRTSGGIKVYKRKKYPGVYIFDKGVLKYYDGDKQQESTSGLNRVSKSNIDLKIKNIYKSIKRLTTIADLKKKIEDKRDDGDDDNTFENIGINRKKPGVKDLNKAKIWNEIFDNNYDFDSVGDDEDDARKDFVELTSEILGNKSINKNKILAFKEIWEKLDLPYSDWDDIKDINNKDLNILLISKIGAFDNFDLINFLKTSEGKKLLESGKTFKGYFLDMLST